MAKISELSDGGSLQSTDFLIAVRSGGNVKVQADGNLSLGSVTADGLTVDGNAEISGALPRLILSETDATDLNTAIRNNGGVFKVQTVNDAANSFTSRMDIDHSSGDISFYEDTGTTEKFFWDASAESLGIGTSSPNYVLNTNYNANATFSNAASDFTQMWQNSDVNGLGVALADDLTARLVTNNGYALAFNNSGAEAMRIDASGNVGIGTGSPSSYFSGATNLVLSGTGDSGLTINSGTSNIGRIHFADGTSGNSRYEGYIVYEHTDDSMQFATVGVEAMRIDSSGNVGIGVSSPTGLLTLGTGTFSAAAANTSALYTSTTAGLVAVADGFLLVDRAGADVFKVDSSGNLLVGTATSPAANTPTGVRYGPGHQAGTLSSDVTISANTVTNVIDMADAMVSNTSGPGLYLVSIVRHANSFGTNFVGIFGANNAGQCVLYDTLIVNGITVSVSGTSIQISSATADTYNTNVIPLSIDG